MNVSIEKKAIEAGCVAYLHKPFPAERLMQALTKAALATGGTVDVRGQERRTPPLIPPGRRTIAKIRCSVVLFELAAQLAPALPLAVDVFVANASFSASRRSSA